MRKFAKTSLIVFAAIFLAASFLSTSKAQKRLGVYNHNTPAHKTGKYADCNYCHVLPTKNWTVARRDGEMPFPDVRAFPYEGRGHFCNSCHASEVFNRNSTFCGSCHVQGSPFAAMRDKRVLAFPNRSHASQFKTIFPHDLHQEVFAKNKPKGDYAAAHFIPASFRPAGDEAESFYSCSVCHESPKKVPLKIGVQMPTETAKLIVDGKPVVPNDALDRQYITDKLRKEAEQELVAEIKDKPEAEKKAAIDKKLAEKLAAYDERMPGFFKTSPENHASCFNCHYQYKNLPNKPKDCSACHDLAEKKADREYLKKRSEVGAVDRYSLKFDHEDGGHNILGCTICHVRIAQSDDVRAKNMQGQAEVAEVPIVTCRDCHSKAAKGTGTDYITDEIKMRKDKPAFQCVACHSAKIGIYAVPESHTIADRQ